VGFSVCENGKRGTFTFVAVFFPLAFLVAMAVLTGGDAIAEDGGDPTHLPIGDWNITEETVIEGKELIVTGDINVGQMVTLTIIDSTIRINNSVPHQFTMRVGAGATLTVVGSDLHLDMFESEPSSGLDLSGTTLVSTSGTCLLRSKSLFADEVTFSNIAPTDDPGPHGQDAVLVLDGQVNSEFRNVTILNKGGDAGQTGPGADGAQGGSSYLYSNVSNWYDCTIRCTAGLSGGGGLGLIGNSGGSGGLGGHVELWLRTSLMHGVVIEVMASDGGIGARGSRNTAGNGGDGGNGAMGGAAMVSMVTDFLELMDCSITALSGNGGSGGNGGEAIDGDGGVAGEGADGGDATITIQCSGDIQMKGVTMDSIGGEGGYGGDYGRLEGGTGTFGVPRPGGDGGDATVQVSTDGSMVTSDLNITARGGAGLDGGGGYDQGEWGGSGGDGEVAVHAEGTVNATDLYLYAYGGTGGPGGPAFSDIRGNGGDGGDARVQFDGALRTYARYFELWALAGEGGLGNKAIYDGQDGINILDIDTLLLEAWEGTFHHSLDDLHGEAKGYLYNVIFDMEFGIHVLPMASAEIWEYYSLDLQLMSDVPSGTPDYLVDWDVHIFDVETGAVMKAQKTDREGRVRFWILAFHYTSEKVSYHGSIIVACVSPSRLVTYRVRFEVQGRIDQVLYISVDEPLLVIHIETPVAGRTYTFDRRLGDHPSNVLDCRGRIQRTDHGYLRTVSVKLYEGSLVGRRVGSWDLRFVTGPDPLDPQPMIYRPDPEVYEWVFHVGVEVFNGSLDIRNGTYVFEVIASDGTIYYVETVGFTLDIIGFNVPPVLTVGTHINGTVWEGEEMLVQGEALDDVGIVKVEYNLDGTGWRTAEGKEYWQFIINTSLLDNGTHNLSIRAVDLYTTSAVHKRTFTVDLPEPGTDGPPGPDGDDGWDLYTYLFIGSILAVVVFAVVTAIHIVRRRSPPDVSGEG
jgi:hypothetical protein